MQGMQQDQRFKLRRREASKSLKEFNLCVGCWVKEKTQSDDNTAPQNKQTTGAIFDVLSSASIHTAPSNRKSISTVSKSLSRQHPPGFDHYIFDGTYGWMVAESKPQPTIKLRIFTNKSDYDHLNIPYRRIKSTTYCQCHYRYGRTVIVDGNENFHQMWLQRNWPCPRKT